MSKLSSEEAIQGWHQVAVNLKLQNYCEKCSNRQESLNHGIISQGVTYQVLPPIEVCHHGLHGCHRLIDTFGYFSSGIVCKVLSWGEVVCEGNKYASEFRKVIAIYDLRASYRRMIKQVFLRVEKSYWIKCQLENMPELWKKVRRLIIRFLNALYTPRFTEVKDEVMDRLIRLCNASSFTVLKAFKYFITRMLAFTDLELLLRQFTFDDYLLMADVYDLMNFANDFLLRQIKRYGCKLIYNPSLYAQELGRV